MTQWIVTSCVLILAVLGLRFILKGRVSLRLQYALWLLVAVRLLVPLTFGESNISAANLSQNAQPMVQQMEAVEIPVQSFDSAYEEVVQEHIQQGQDISGFENTEELEYEAYERMEKVSLSQVLLWVWVGGMALSLAALLFSNLHFYFKLRKARRPIVLPDTKLPVYCAPQIVTPCLFGLFRPAIYVTEEVLEDPLALQHVLAHEHTHHRHGDHIWSILRGLCLCIHWYNPLVWTAAQVSRRDAELACDEAAIASLGEENRLDYGRTLIGLTCAKGVSPLLTATTMTGSKHSIKERITLIAKKPEFSLIALIALILAVTVAAGCSFTGPVSPRESLDYSVYAFPGTEWGMTPEEVMDSLNLTEKDVTIEYDDGEDSEKHIQFIKKDYEDVFGAPAQVQFRFATITMGNIPYTYLDMTAFEYADDTDMETIKQNIIGQYGEPASEDAPSMFYGWSADKKNSDGHNSVWISDTKLGSFVNDQTLDFFILTTGASYLTNEADWYDKALEELEADKADPAAAIWWTDDSNWLTMGKAGKEPGKKWVILEPLKIQHLNAYTRSGVILPTRGLLDDPRFEIFRDTYNELRTAVFRYQAGAGIYVKDYEFNLDQMNHDVRSEKLSVELILYRGSYRIKPSKFTDDPQYTEGLVRNGRWLEDAEPEFFLVYHQLPVTDEDGKITTEEKWSVWGEFTQEQLAQKYGTDEMIAEYGDMYTAAAMEHGKSGFEIYYP